MPILRKFMIAALAVGSTVIAPSVAFAATTQAAAARPAAATSSAAPAIIRKVPCRSYTFNVFYGTHRESCYGGTGAARLAIKNVHRITTGRNAGQLCVQARALRTCVNFRRGETLTFPSGKHVELVFLKIGGI